jgi:hypothetical protein
MGDFFVLQMDDFFTEGLCFDNQEEGEGGARRFGSSPFCENQRMLALPHWAGSIGPGAPD